MTSLRLKELRGKGGWGVGQQRNPENSNEYKIERDTRTHARLIAFILGEFSFQVKTSTYGTGGKRDVEPTLVAS